MATPYLQFRFEMVPSTQDLAKERFNGLPVLVQATSQKEGRGRSGSTWLNADRALAASLAITVQTSDRRPFSLMAGIAVTRAVEEATLKWPNDVLVGGSKAGGILVERAGNMVVIGLGLNLWWPHPPEGATALYDSDPGAERHAEIGGLWAAELMRLLDGEGWPLDEYESKSATLGEKVTWETDGSGKAVEVAADGGLVVELAGGLRKTLYSGAVRHLRH